MTILEGMSLQAIRRRAALAAMVLCAAAATVSAQQKLLTLDDIYGTENRVNFSGRPATGLTWIDATRYAWPRPATSGVDWTTVEAVSGRTEPLFDAAKMEAGLAALAGVSGSDARTASHSRDLTFNAKRSAAAVTIASDLYLYAFDTDQAARLTSAPGEEAHASFSPDGTLIAFVRGNNLFVVDVAARRESQLTRDGASKILNGVLDWVYEEEIYGRGEKRGYWWSPDSTRLAFLRIDDSPVPTYITMDSIPNDPTIETWHYPKAGDPNPIATLGVVSAGGGPVDWVDTTKYPAADSLIVRVAWTPDSQKVVYDIQNRTQTWLDLNTWDLSRSAAVTIMRESNNYWITSDDAHTPTWLKDGTFLWPSDRSGWKHLYHFRADGTLIKQVTDGKWELRTLHGVDEASGWIYFSSTERSPIGDDVYRIKFDGTGMRRLSAAAGTHQATFNPGFTLYIDSWSDATTPTQVKLARNDGSEVRVIDENRVAALAQYRLSKPEYLQVKTRDGFVMDAVMIKPPDFDPSRKYPVYQFTYAGPRNPQVRNAWGGAQYMYHQLLAQKGIIVWICDNRSASGKGAESSWVLKGRFGEGELRDIEDGVAWLKQQPYVDGSRIGMHGWSFGGYITSYALTHSTNFVMGIAGGTVADWRDYDSVYTERYLGTPQDNPDGYRDSSPRWSAANLHGDLLLVHGEIDENVHLANTMQFAYELQKAQKPFDLMIYPKSRHGIVDPQLVRHLRGTMLDFVLAHLKPESGRGESSSK